MSVIGLIGLAFSLGAALIFIAFSAAIAGSRQRASSVSSVFGRLFSDTWRGRVRHISSKFWLGKSEPSF